MKGEDNMKGTIDDEPLIPLSEALRLLKSDPLTAHLSDRAFRKAVQNGEVFFQRNSKAKKARYYVRLGDLRKLAVTHVPK